MAVYEWQILLSVPLGQWPSIYRHDLSPSTLTPLAAIKALAGGILLQPQPQVVWMLGKTCVCISIACIQWPELSEFAWPSIYASHTDRTR